MKLDLQMYTGSYTVTVYKDANMTTATASPNSTLDKDDEVTLTLTPASGYEVDEVEVISGGVTVNMETKKFAMGEANVVLYVKSKSSSKYKIMERVYTCVNGTVTVLNPNVVIKYAKTGAIEAVDCDGTSLASLNADILASLVADGIAIKM